MNPSEYFRFVERRQTGVGPDGMHFLISVNHVLQQWWESEKMINPPPGEWRDVPLLPEDNTPPYEWSEVER